ncbi:MAG: helix-turn-helix domain-containing protein [Actinomycetales bacterium]|nr:helix-turn-helix domain-containing protein [Actinomycetales bacterium]
MDLPRFLTLSDVADVLNVSAHQAYTLVRSGDLAAIRVGGRGEWRISEADLADFIARQYAEVRRDRVRDAVH